MWWVLKLLNSVCLDTVPVELAWCLFLEQGSFWVSWTLAKRLLWCHYLHNQGHLLLPTMVSPLFKHSRSSLGLWSQLGWGLFLTPVAVEIYLWLSLARNLSRGSEITKICLFWHLLVQVSVLVLAPSCTIWMFDCMFLLSYLPLHVHVLCSTRFMDVWFESYIHCSSSSTNCMLHFVVCHFQFSVQSCKCQRSQFQFLGDNWGSQQRFAGTRLGVLCRENTWGWHLATY